MGRITLLILCISTSFDVAYKKPMFFFLNELDMPFVLYLIWGFISCVIVFIVYNIKNNNLKSKFTFFNSLYIFIISIVFTCVFNILLGSIYFDIILAGLVFIILIWGDDFDFKELVLKFYDIKKKNKNYI